MSKSQEARRNAPCPCGSGKKYKSCCGTSEALAQKNRSQANLFIGLLILGVALAFAASYYSAKSDDSSAKATNASTDGPPYPQPPGDPPPGKVWSAEHGHWHDEGVPEDMQTH